MTRWLKWKQYRLLMGWLVLFAAHHAVAADDLPGAMDLTQITRYPNSWIVDYSQQSVPEYRLATGRMKKINGVVSPESSLYVSGRLTRITYRLPSGRQSSDAVDHFKQQFESLANEPLFQCRGRNCGESNQWANFQFAIPRLYGIDREQYYLALKLTADTSADPSYLAFYTVKRGNKRVYAQIDLVQPDSVSLPLATGIFIEELTNGARVYREQQPTTTEVDGLRQLLAAQPALVLVLIGHSDQGASLEQHQQVSLQQADTLKQWLTDQGIEPVRIQTYGVGGLAPAYDASIPKQRVEWLLYSAEQ
ncbi:MAG: DUF4892 domain-containing protein [Halopseudomonas sp.]